MDRSKTVMPSISVILAHRNHARYLPDAVEALATQSCQPLEILLLDDASNDDSAAVAVSLSKKYKNVRALTNKVNFGPIVSANKLLHLAKGEYIYWAAADDRVFPGFFERSMAMFASHPSAKISCALPAYFHDDPANAKIGNRRLMQVPSGYYSPSDLLKLRWRASFVLAGFAAIARRDAILEIGGFPPELLWHADAFTLYAIAGRYGCCLIPELLAAIRLAPGTYSGSARDWTQQRHIIENVVSKLAHPEYKDIAPFFHKGAIIAGLPGRGPIPGILLLSLWRPSRWRYITLCVWRDTLWSIAVAVRQWIRGNLYVKKNSGTAVSAKH